MTVRQEIEAYCSGKGIRLTPEQIDEAVNLVDNEGCTVEESVNHVDGHPIKPT